MVELLSLALSFAIGITCSLMACCIGFYLGLFAYLHSTIDKPSRLRSGIIILLFAFGMITVVGALGAAFFLLQIGLKSVTSNATTLVDIAGFVVLSVLGASYLTGRTLRIPLPYINPPTSLTTMRGYRAALPYGAFFGGPGAAHCTLTLVIPIIFLSLSSLDPTAVIWNFGFYAIGRILPIMVIGMMLQDAQLRFIKLVTARPSLINRLIGVVMLGSGVSLFFIST